MSLVSCSECNGRVSDRAMTCPHCGNPLRPPTGQGFEYRSRATVWGLPLVHVATGVDGVTGRPRVAKGFFALGNIAVGVFALGGVALGAFTFGGLSVGLLVAVGGGALGLGVSVGGLAVGLFALGGAAVGYWAVGGGAFGVHALGGNAQNPELLERLGPYLNLRR